MDSSFTEIARELHRDIGGLLAAPVLAENSDARTALTAALAVQSKAGSLVAEAARQARSAGSTWQDIGDALGVSRQAAFQRFGKPIDPRTGEAMNTAPLPESISLTESVIDELTTAHWDDTVRRFDPTLRAGLGSDGLAAAWAQVIAAAGAFEGHGEIQAARTADITTTNTPLNFEAGDFTARISFRDDLTIAGLYLLAPTT